MAEPSLIVKAIQCIDFICLVECRDDDDDKAMAMIHKFAHCVNKSFSCYNTHNGWRQELEKFWQDLRDRGEIKDPTIEDIDLAESARQVRLDYEAG